MMKVQQTDQQLNLKLALLCGHEEITEREDVLNRRQRNDYVGGGVVVLYGDHYIVRANGRYGRWDPCNDPAASLEVEKVAIHRNPRKYIDALIKVVLGDVPLFWLEESYIFNLHHLEKFMSASPRERAEAAHTTLQST